MMTISRTPQRGMILVLAAAFAVVLTAFCALVLGMGFVAAHHSTVQGISNLAALGAIEQYTRSEESTEAGKRNEAIRRAEDILRANAIPGLSRPLGQVGELGSFSVGESEAVGAGGKVTFGKWLKPIEDATERNAAISSCTAAAQQHCAEMMDESKPCFCTLAATNNSERASAVRLQIETPSDNQFMGFFTQVLGVTSVGVAIRATAAVVERCVGLLMDVSRSAVGETHPVIESADEPFWREWHPGYPTPPNTDPFPLMWFREFRDVDENGISDFGAPDVHNLGLWALRRQDLYHDGVTPPNCKAWDTYDPEGEQQLLAGPVYFCHLDSNLDMPDMLGEPVDTSRADATGAEAIAAKAGGAHYRSDYGFVNGSEPRMHSSPFGRVTVDLYTRPEPMTTFFLGFNAGLRLLMEKASAADQAYIWPFTGLVNLPVPDSEDIILRAFPEPPEYLSKNLGFMLHLTNLENIGRVDEEGNLVEQPETPNAVSRGWIPLVISDAQGLYSGTNLYGALWEAAQMMGEQCPDGSRKVVVIATDGMPSCWKDGATPGMTPEEEVNCISGLGGYFAPNREAQVQAALDALRERQILVSVMFAGNTVRPNYRNVKSDPSCDTNQESESCFLDASIYNGIAPCTSFYSEPADEDLFDCVSYYLENGAVKASTSSEEDQLVFNNLGVPGFSFGHPIYAMADLAYQTGGYFCNLLSEEGADVDDYIDHDNDTEGNCIAEFPCCKTALVGGVCPPESVVANCTPCRLRNSERTEGATETRPDQYLSRAAQAAICVEKSVGDNPFIVIEEES